MSPQRELGGATNRTILHQAASLTPQLTLGARQYTWRNKQNHSPLAREFYTPQLTLGAHEVLNDRIDAGNANLLIGDYISKSAI